MSEEGKITRSIHVIPLKRVYWGRRTNRADRAVRLIRKYVRRHFKEAEKIIIDPAVNEYVWSRSREKPPRRVIVEIRFDKEEKTAKVLLIRSSKAKIMSANSK
ncbi:LSU ribosomal protein L31E [Staphylothermus marinus F1]|uniref:Large ribosomal subunit protein eL31 n=1 Tax=Staphylothermus marinus (strain ATCC 43588 / DSM 3639 / JCM 9404 / F1) TaxID=399550 RepID=RL31_STAMF|nr:50S ribosomal protein L31e [Staphylothermus marinus]A3DNH4.1 RecName: Full=Large ribosomal subunit protein eL31; AltName: Full=50S ribosomal protein L31e [Staphylothermus marinus F1]ABN70184.1 LSU ribosomal protein L31E [Staphylothermus marinus F1]